MTCKKAKSKIKPQYAWFLVSNKGKVWFETGRSFRNSCRLNLARYFPCWRDQRFTIEHLEIAPIRRKRK